MNWLDIVIILLLLLAVWEGWRKGAVTQILGLGALVAGIFLGWKFGPAIGSWMGLDAPWAMGAGFAAVFVVVIVALVVIGRVTRGLFRIVGLGVFDSVLGVVFSALKMAIFVWFLVLFIGICDPDGRVIADETKEQSKAYKAIGAVNGLVFPFVRDLINKGE
ncbi:MAG: CvpA family protein [Alistipes sp.]|jgi:membrane protein required for colicin V production|nr:CvpA family protein [Alistipes sp.]